MKNVLVVLGTRPEGIKLARVIHALREGGGVRVGVCVTAQHRELLDDVLTFFAISPDHDMDVMTPGQSLEEVTTSILTRFTPIVEAFKPDWIVVQGDTTTVLAASLVAYYRRIPVAHVEAGLRTGNIYAPWPEEVNRRVAGAIAELHFAPTEQARKNLLREGVPESRVEVTGNTVVDALLYTVERFRGDKALTSTLDQKFAAIDPSRPLVLVTSHRRENFGAGLAGICEALKRLASEDRVEIVYPVHPNPNVEGPVRKALGGCPRVHLVAPQDYATFTYLMYRSTLVLTDSGGIQEEAPSLGKPVLVLREATERPEAVSSGWAKVVGTQPSAILAEARRLLGNPSALRGPGTPNPFGDGRAAERIASRLRREPARRD